MMNRWGLMLVLAVVLTGCSTKFVYNNIDWLLVDYLDNFVELNDEQEDWVSKKIDRLSEWHRREEVPNYIEHLDQLIALDPKRFSEADLDVQRQLFQQHTQRLVKQVAPAVLTFVGELSDEQAEELMDNIRVRHTRYKNKYQPLSDKQIRQKYLEKIHDNVDDWFGYLTPEQDALIDQWSAELSVTAYDWIDYQTDMRIEIKDLLNHRMQRGYLQSHLQSLLFNPASFYSPELEQKIDHNQSVANQYIVKMINSVSDKQTKHYREKLEDWKTIAQDIQ
ncbi:DUF6279 family lipoprotein [Vibrio ostreicida]|uniref:DUF6279 family lipoprotein n=2 Tax=Vibrio ostreicida TaxID=526588 RepID=A0ABT8BXU4_9VIBR|nr:DUF6279 family lipoprotein [Vibrio ostreicida]MDN3611881.1 DUF6279 family lipoprotein [Vibrio ostreicida]